MRLTYQRPHKPMLLMDELLAAFPAWRGDSVGVGFRNPRLRVSSRDDTVWLDVPEDADLAAVNAVVMAHDATKESLSERAGRVRREALGRLKADPRMADLVQVLGL